MWIQARYVFINHFPLINSNYDLFRKIKLIKKYDFNANKGISINIFSLLSVGGGAILGGGGLLTQ